MNNTIAITGASGFIGKSLLHYFSSKGWNVRALQRNPAKSSGKISYHAYELPDRFDEKILEGVDVLIHCAVQHYTPSSKNTDTINEKGAETLIRLCRKTGTRLVFLSTLSAHEQAQSHYGQNKLKLEGMFDLAKDLVLKLGLVVGHTGGLFHTIYESIKKTNVVPLVGGGKQPVQTIAIDDLCRIIASGISNHMSGIYNIAEPDPLPMKELYTLIARQLGKEPKFVPVPAFLLLIACHMAELIGVKLPISSENVLGLKQLKSFDTAADLKKFGIRVKPFKESIRLTQDSFMTSRA
jgi:nucleoside-diphosphate-sugar epimerase